MHLVSQLHMFMFTTPTVRLTINDARVVTTLLCWMGN